MKKKYLIGLLSVATILVLAGCATGNGPESTGGEGEGEGGTVMIGGLAPLTGDAASYGVEFQRLAELALEDVNALWADKDMELDIQWEDGACNGNDASTAAQKLVDMDGVKVILGGFCSSETLAAAYITESAEVILFSPGSSSPDVSTAGDYVFRNWPSDAFQGQKLAELAWDLGYESVAMLTEQQDYTFGISSVFIQEFEAMGGTVIEETYLSEDTDVKTQLTRLNSETVDVYFVNPQTPIKADLILKQMSELGMEGPFLLNDVAGTSNDILEGYGDFIEGSYTATVNLDEDSDGIIQLQSRYNELYGEDVSYLAYGVAAYDAVWILANAIMEVGNDGTAVKDYLSDFPGYEGLMGSVSFDENGDPITGHSIFKIEGGTLVLQ